MKVKTRSSTSHATFGTPLPELPACQLPTQLHVCRHFIFVKENKFKSNKEVAPIVSRKVVSLWEKGNLPTQSFKTINRNLIRLMDRGSAYAHVTKIIFSQCSI